MTVKVLIVDDLPLNLKLLRISLHAEGLEIVEAENGREALEILSRERVDCVVTDILMPEMDGYRLCQAIRANDKLNHLPIIVYTATYVSETDKALAFSAGADVYLRKPAPVKAMCDAIRALAAQKNPRKNETPKPEGVLKQYSDVLIKKLEERNLQLQGEEEKFRQITDSIQEVFWMMSADFSKVIYISPTYETIWGRTCASLYESPRNWMDAVHPEDRDRTEVEASVERLAGQALEMEYRIVRPDGGVRWVRVRSFPVKDETGKVYRISGTALDITEQKRLLAQFQQAQKMDAVGRLAGGVAHDFNNLLTVILGLSELNILVLPAGNEQRADFEEIKATAERAAQLTHQLLAFSRRQVLEPQVADLNELVANAERLLTRLIGEDITLTTALSASARPVLIDPGQVGQVLMNLCVNARDAMPRGGSLRIETMSVSLDTELRTDRFTIPAGEYSTVTVADTGEGMTDEVKSHLFEPFFTTKPLGKGTGLGLATCYGIVKQSKGFVISDSELGKGSSFTIYFPVSNETAEARIKSGAPSLRARGVETILVVEDEASVRGLIGRILRAEGYEVLEGTNGEDGLRIAEADHQKAIRLVLTDVVMPLMNGKLLADSIKRTRPDMKVLFASGYSDDTLSHQGVLDAGVAFIRKPFTPESLARKVRKVLDAVPTDRSR